MRHAYTRLLGNVGDRDMLNGAAWVYVTYTKGVGHPMLEIVEPDGDEPGCGYTVYRFDLDRHIEVRRGDTVYFVHDTLEDFEGLTKSHEEWFVGDLEAIERSCGRDNEHAHKLRWLLASERPMIRALAYMDIVGYHGAHEFDHYPIQLTEQEVKARYRKWDKHKNNR